MFLYVSMAWMANSWLFFHLVAILQAQPPCSTPPASLTFADQLQLLQFLSEKLEPQVGATVLLD